MTLGNEDSKKIRESMASQSTIQKAESGDAVQDGRKTAELMRSTNGNNTDKGSTKDINMA